MKMGTGGATRRAHGSDLLALLERVALPDRHSRQVQKGTVEAHAMIQNHEVAFQAEGRGSGKRDCAIGRPDDGRASSSGDVQPAMVCRRLAAINTLRSEAPAEAPTGGCDEVLPPTVGWRVEPTRRFNPANLDLADPAIGLCRASGRTRHVDPVDRP